LCSGTYHYLSCAFTDISRKDNVLLQSDDKMGRNRIKRNRKEMLQTLKVKLFIYLFLVRGVINAGVGLNQISNATYRQSPANKNLKLIITVYNVRFVPTSFSSNLKTIITLEYFAFVPKFIFSSSNPVSFWQKHTHKTRPHIAPFSLFIRVAKCVKGVTKRTYTV
jgi:hypothetical protein